MIGWKTSKLIAIYLVGFVILPGLILSASVDISTGPPASLCDPSVFPICSCDAEIVVCQFSDNYNITQVNWLMTFGKKRKLESIFLFVTDDIFR